MSGPTAFPVSDFPLHAARGLVPGVGTVLKFGRAENSTDNTPTDIWQYAVTQQIWLAPTAARVHALVSDDANDDVAGSGARTVRVWGLQAWDSAETFEDVNLDGLTPVNTVNSYVTINRMRVIDWDTTQNAGIVTATAATDNTVSAAIAAGVGQTQLAVYGVPSIKTFYMTAFYASMNDTSQSRTIDMNVLVALDPENHPTIYNNLRDFNIKTSGASSFRANLTIPEKIVGPCIIKMQGVGNVNNLDCVAGFEGYLVDN